MQQERGLMVSNVLRKVGMGLLPGDSMEVAVELEEGLTDELESGRATLLLTNRRIVRYSTTGHRLNVSSLALDDVNGIDIIRVSRNIQWVWVGILFIIGGALLGALSLLLVASPATPIFMAVALGLIGTVFILTYAGGLRGEVRIHAGQRGLHCVMQPKALDDMAVFVERFYEIRLGTEVQSENSHNSKDGANWATATVGASRKTG
jgi:hypothetical protein